VCFNTFLIRLVDVAKNLQVTRVIIRGWDRSCDSFVIYHSIKVFDILQVACICLSMQRLWNGKGKAIQLQAWTGFDKAEPNSQLRGK
jgi:hypothetical protein